MKVNSCLAQVWGVTLFCLPDGGQALLERLVPLSDKIPWPVRQKEATQITFLWVAIPAFPVGLCNVPGTWDTPLSPPCSVHASEGWRWHGAKSFCVQADLDKGSFPPETCHHIKITRKIF